MASPFNLASNFEPIIFSLPVKNDKGEWEDKEFPIKRFLRKDRRAWRAILDKEREDRATAHLDREEKMRSLLLYPIAPLSHEELNARIYTDDGACHVFLTCCRSSGVPEETCKAIEEGEQIDEKDIVRFALILANVVTVEKLTAQLLKEKGETSKDKSRPLTDSGGD